MSASNRRDFFRKASAAAGLAAAGLVPRRITAARETGFRRVMYRMLGSTGFQVSEVGFGAMNMRDRALVEAAIDYGINYIDTAYIYQRGHNEEVIGSALKSTRDRVFLTTKLPVRDPGKVTEMLATSLKRLQTDHVDLVLVHGADSRKSILNEETMKAFDDTRKKGMTRFVGISSHSNQAEALDLVLESKFWEAALIGYNYTSPPSVTAAIERARRQGIAIIGMKNLLTSQWPPSPLKDMREDGSGKLSAAQALFKWVLNDRYVDTIVPGITSFEQLDEDAALMGMKMSFEDKSELRRYGELIRGRYCSGVAGCTECFGQCPRGVMVNELNRCLMYAYGYGDMELAHENYNELPASTRVEVCMNCDECMVQCAHGIDINERIQQAKALFAKEIIT